MPEQPDWVTKRMAAATTDHPSVTDVVVQRLEKELRSKLQEKPLTSAERASFATELLKAMIPPQPQVEETG